MSIPELAPLAVLAYARNPKDDGLTDDYVSSSGTTINGIPNCLAYLICNINRIKYEVNIINQKGFGDAIVALFTIPALAFNSAVQGYPSALEILQDNTYSKWLQDRVMSQSILKQMGTRPTDIDGYQVRNKKLLTYPYIYLAFNPPFSNPKIYRYEDFGGNGTAQANFRMISEINPNPCVKFIPQGYRGKAGNAFQDCTELTGYPQLSWYSDYFNAWLAQNTTLVNLAMGQEQYNYQIDSYKRGIQGGLDILGKSFSLNLTGAISEGVNLGLDLAQMDKNHEYYVSQQLAQIDKQSLLPNSGTLGSSNATLMGYGFNTQNIFTVYTIRDQFASRIDKFFDMYGYQTNELKKPNLNNRPNWNYVKTININIIGNIPQIDMQLLKNMFNQGITLWHNHETFGDYSQNNR